MGALLRAVSSRSLDERARGRFEKYLELLLLWNRTQNLTGLRTREEMIRGLFEDSLLFLPLLPAGPLRIVDIGAGAGVPGMPLAVVDERLSVVLVESRQKRVSFLRTVSRELDFGTRVSVEEGRAEVEAAGLVRRHGWFDVAVARAVAAPSAVRTIAFGLIKPGGLVIVSGPPNDGGQSSSVEGARQIDVQELGLRRTFFTFQRTA